jgi:hypothetical protein
MRGVITFQDTNALVFRALTAALGVSAKSGFVMNSLAVPRRAKEAIGAITRLTNATGEVMKCSPNVGSMLAQCWLNVISMLFLCSLNVASM